MPLYRAFYNGRAEQIEAPDLYSAKLKAIDKMKVKKRDQNLLAIVLIHNGKTEVRIDPASL